jgi:hypothetical protein
LTASDRVAPRGYLAGHATLDLDGTAVHCTGLG